MSRHTFTVDLSQQGMRLDHFISTALGDISKRKAKSLVDDGDAFVNGSRQKIAAYILKKGDEIIVIRRLPNGEPARKSQPGLPLDAILHLDGDLVILNKPAGVAAQPTRDPAVLPVAAILALTLKEMGEDFSTLLPVHRLDKETTGCMVVARNRQSMTYMTQLLRNRAVSKVYHAICHGRPPGPFTEKAALTPIHPATGRVKIVQSGGRQAVTEFTPLEHFAKWNLSLVAARPVTGRSHQIRVHLEKNHYPIIGDKVYGNPANQTPLPDNLLALLDHHMLHAHSITFVPPGGTGPFTVSAPYPATMQRILDLCRSVKK